MTVKVSKAINKLRKSNKKLKNGSTEVPDTGALRVLFSRRLIFMRLAEKLTKDLLCSFLNRILVHQEYVAPIFFSTVHAQLC